MTNLYLYADEKSRSVILDSTQKIITIGGDFGYGNFGDVLQKINALKIIKKNKQFSTVAVMASNAIDRQDFPEWVISAYSTDAVIFVSEYPLILSAHDPSLQLVTSIKNLAGVYLYGGGFLNSIWGDYVLSVVEQFLKKDPQISYWASGQQVTPPFENRVIEHINNFKPRLFGVRDERSIQLLSDVGFNADYSFDDATEELILLNQKLHTTRGEGLLLHVNASDYTANKSIKYGLGRQLSDLSKSHAAKNGVTIFQAFRDSRQDVLDSTETIKQLGSYFPFHDTRLVDLVGLLFDQSTYPINRPVQGDFGYSCSYHVTLWLQLAGIPCWLRSSNTFYDQKSRALQVTQGLEEFIREPKLADHRFNLERRQIWAERFQNSLNSIDTCHNEVEFNDDEKGPAPWPFLYKGKPTYQEKLNEHDKNLRWHLERADAAEHDLHMAQEQSNEQKIHTESLESQLAHSADEILLYQQRTESLQLHLDADLKKTAELNIHLEAVSQQLTEVGHNAHQQHQRAELAENSLGNAKINIEELQNQAAVSQARIEAVTAQLTEVGHNAHRQRQRAELAENRLETASINIGELQNQAAVSQAKIEALTAQLNEVDHNANLQHQRAELAETRLETASINIGELQNQAAVSKAQTQATVAEGEALKARLHVLATSRTHRATLKYYRLYEHGATRWFMRPLRRVSGRILRLIKG